MGGYAVESTGLGKRFGARWAVQDVALRAPVGGIYGFLGRNGAGKTTFIRLLLGLLHPSAGRICVFGHDVSRDRIKAARQVGALLEARATYDQLTGRENLNITRQLLKLPSAEIDRVLEAVEMRDAADRKLGHYSLGMRQRLGLARAMLGRPRLLVLDEPMNGLDPDGIRDMRDIIRTLPERVGATVFMSSHMLSEVEQTATHIGLMHDGQLILDGPIADMLRLIEPELSVRSSDPGRAAQVLKAAGYVTIEDGATLLVKAGADREAARINRLLLDAGVDVIELSFRRANLEALYVSVQHQKAEAA
ncbi:MAG: ATP-binding cassette domain-containing protein [Hyphomonadaceae bacterium]|nr:ATP-binding cassette domain-containing protein [Hyphomonadaceae bacterium]